MQAMRDMVLKLLLPLMLEKKLSSEGHGSLSYGHDSLSPVKHTMLLVMDVQETETMSSTCGTSYGRTSMQASNPQPSPYALDGGTGA